MRTNYVAGYTDGSVTHILLFWGGFILHLLKNLISGDVRIPASAPCFGCVR